MLHSKVYNAALTTDIKDAYRNNDVHFFHREIQSLCALVAARGHGGFNIHEPYDADLTRLQICISIHDSMVRHGMTLQLLCDYVNF